MSREFDGYINLSRAAAAFIETEIRWQRRTITAPLLLDTGSPATIISPRDANRLYGPSYLEQTFVRNRARAALRNFAGDQGSVTVDEMSVTVFDRAGNPYERTLSVYVARPNPPLPARRGNWLYPSICGRDFLIDFESCVRFDPPSVRLTLLDRD